MTIQVYNGNPQQPVASFTKEVDLWLAKRPSAFNGHLANRGLTSLVKEAIDHPPLAQTMLMAQCKTAVTPVH